MRRLSADPSSTLGTDPDLEPGFPVQTLERAGTFHAGVISAVVGWLAAILAPSPP